jgi:response regulator RpfG family c-di-GMP phosphodiesterase
MGPSIAVGPMIILLLCVWRAGRAQPKMVQAGITAGCGAILYKTHSCCERSTILETSAIQTSNPGKEKTTPTTDLSALAAAYHHHNDVKTQLADFELYCQALTNRDAIAFVAVTEAYRQHCHTEGFILGEVTALRWGGEAHQRLGNNEQGLIQLFEGLHLANQVGDQPILRGILLTIGTIYYEIGDYLSATDFIERSLVHARLHQNSDGLSRGVFMLGLVQLKLGQLESAMQNFNSAKDLAVTPKSRDIIGWALVQSARIYRSSAQHEANSEKRTALLIKGLEKSRAGLDVALDLQDLILQVEAESTRVLLFCDLDQEKQALASQQRVFELASQLGSEHYIAETLLETLGLVKSGQAVANGERALAIAKQLGNQALMAQVYQALAQQFKLEGNYREALQCFEAHIDLDKAVRSAQATAQATAAAVRLESERIRSRAEELEHLVGERTKELEQSRFDMLERLASIAEFRDEDTGNHMTRVSMVAVAIAEAMGCEKQQLQYLYVAAKLHDIGKIAVPDQILFKQGKLSPGEWAMMQIHTNLGAKMLSGSAPILRMASEIALSHHERFDGTGYPQQLQGDDIPLWGRIVAVADVFDALQSERPYKPAWSKIDAIAEIRVQSGKMFDSKVVKAFLTVVNS